MYGSDGDHSSACITKNKQTNTQRESTPPPFTF